MIRTCDTRNGKNSCRLTTEDNRINSVLTQELRTIIRNSEPADVKLKSIIKGHANREKKILFFGAVFATTIFAIQLLIARS